MLRWRWVAALFLLVCAGGGRMGPLAPPAFAQAREASRARRADEAPAAEVTVVLSEQFFNSFLDEVFKDLKPPSYKIAASGPREDTRGADAASVVSAHASSTGQGECASVVVLEREMEGVRTSVHFENGRIVAPLAFSGSYVSTLLGCLKFQGWADTVMKLEFDRARQVLNARVTVNDIHLSNAPKLASSLLVGLVQKAIDLRINPVEILQSAQLSARVPVAAAGGAIRLRAREVRPEILDGTLQLHIIYEFTRAD